VVGGFRIEAEQEVAQERIDHGAGVAGLRCGEDPV
jgi:hypothetical protein